MKFDELAKRLRAFEQRRFGSGAGEASIQNAEEALRIQLPESYKSFLREFGWGGVEHLEIYGLGGDVPEYLSVERLTMSEREEMRPRISPHLVPILNDGGGNHYCLDTNRMNGPECPVVFWDHDSPESQAPEEISQGFVEWLNAELDEL